MRGHVIRVRAPWVKANYFINEDNYILPNLSTVVLIPHPSGVPPKITAHHGCVDFKLQKMGDEGACTRACMPFADLAFMLA